MGSLKILFKRERERERERERYLKFFFYSLKPIYVVCVFNLIFFICILSISLFVGQSLSTNLIVTLGYNFD